LEVDAAHDEDERGEQADGREDEDADLDLQEVVRPKQVLLDVSAST
jgi:hypothetical protein